MLNAEFCFGQIESKSSVSHLSGDVEWAVECAHLGLWREAKAGEGHFRITSKSSVKFSFEMRCYKPGWMDIRSKHLLQLPQSQNFFLGDFSCPGNSLTDWSSGI